MNKLSLDKLVEINPEVNLIKGERYPRVMMGDINPGHRYPSINDWKEFEGGGTKFEDGDVLFARITPSLENGKIAQFKSQYRYGFGSTEFIVFRARENITVPSFVYYLATTDIIRKPAEKSMYGASGRQRVDIDVIKKIKVPAPSIEKQRKIGNLLSAYDNLIQENIRRIEILEEIATLVYMNWFVDFHFPGHEDVPLVDSEIGEIPKGWEVINLGQAMNLEYGKGLRKKDRVEGPYPVYGSSGIIDWHNEPIVEGPGIIVGRKGNVGSIYWEERGFCPIDTVYYVVSEISYRYIYFYLLNQNFISSDTAVPGLNRGYAYSIPFLLPDEQTLTRFNQIVKDIFDLSAILDKKNTVLSKLRDLLLPGLVTGDIEVERLL